MNNRKGALRKFVATLPGGETVRQFRQRNRLVACLKLAYLSRLGGSIHRVCCADRHEAARNRDQRKRLDRLRYRACRLEIHHRPLAFADGPFRADDSEFECCPALG
jgi:hypothetical protein